MERIIKTYGIDSPMMRGYLCAKDDPLFKGQTVDRFDAIIQGHVHWKLYESSPSTDFYSIRAVGMAYKNDPIDTASYVILTETDNGFEIEEIVSADKHQGNHNRDKAFVFQLQADFGHYPAQGAGQGQNKNRDQKHQQQAAENRAC